MKTFKAALLTIILSVNLMNSNAQNSVYRGGISNFEILPQYLINGKLKVDANLSTITFEYKVQFYRSLSSFGANKWAPIDIAVRISIPDINNTPLYFAPYQNVTSADFASNDEAFLTKTYSVTINKSRFLIGVPIILAYKTPPDPFYFAYNKMIQWQAVNTQPPLNYGNMPQSLRQYARENGPLSSIPMTLIYPNDTDPVLTVSSSIYSPNSLYRITLQTDGNVVLYKRISPTTEQPLWWTGTQSSSPKPQSLFFQTDAHLVLYRTTNLSTNYLWYSNRYNNAGLNTINGTNAVYALQDDGNFVLYWRYVEAGVDRKWVLASSGTQSGVSAHPGNLFHQ